ncbi:hypothetical protein B0I08_102167 [Glaciihabitans tibetensis]|uniref:CBM6 domain-containing protein n=1 Tax=Glaciihabitans tibetensis TaxID=1266600 RepID=A0A2T0VHE6_9MICO|nr:hypothetical protein [Glaciihabitans tibetensis]PRY69493.1 hypothetical protein B0I08_102167 [Glaciihabitans tibetensis]
MKNAPKTIAWVATAALAAGGLFVPLAATAAEPQGDVLQVDFSAPTGDFRGGATGTLYGFGDEGAPTQAVINGAHITNTSQKAPYGTQHPSGDSLKVEDGFFDKHGEDMYIYTQDYYPDWAYNGGVRPGDTRTYNQADGTYTSQPNGTWDYLEVVEFVTEAVATSSSSPADYVHIPFNEPDAGNWYANWATMKNTFLADWEAVYTTIQEVYERHGLGHARIGGPGDAAYRSARTGDILTFAQSTGTLPDIMIWHELGIDNLATFRSHLDDYRGLETARGIDPIAVNITEFGMLRDMGTPGQLIQWLAMFEDEKVDAQTAYWNYAGNLSDNSARTNSANGGWWMFKWYGDLEGSETVAVTPPQLNVADTLQGIAAVDTINKRATVLYGGTDESSVGLDLSGIDTAVFGDMVDVEVREATLSGAEGLQGTPRVVLALDDVALSNGTLNISVPSYDRYAAYQVIITPQLDRAVVADPVWSASIEAEDTALTSATADTQDPLSGGGWKFLASHGRDVGSFNRASSKADWTVTVPRDGTYRFQVIGATPGVPGRHALFVDGAHNQTVQYTADLALTATQKWQYRGSSEVSVNLTAGEHLLSLRASENGTQVLPNSDITLDKFVLTDITDGEPTTYPASTLRYYGGAAVDFDTEGARGYGSVRGSDQRIDVYADAWQSGYYDVAVDYRTSKASTITVSVNGRDVTTLEASGGNGWRSTARLHLTQGINEIELRSKKGALIKQVTTTRIASADTAAVTVEAENATLRGAAAVASIGSSTGTNVSGGRYVGYVGNGAANTLEIERAAGINTAGAYNVTVAYSNAELSGAHDYNPQVVDRRIDVSEGAVSEGGVAGSAGSAYFRYTYSWNSFWERTIPVTLTTATDPLVFGNTTAYTPNIDRVTIAPVVLGTPTTVATGPTAPLSTVPLAVNAKSQCINGAVSVAVYALNTATAKADIRLTTGFGDKKFTGITPGSAAYNLFATGATSIDAGTATVAGYTWIKGSGSYSTYRAPYAAISCD